MEDLFCSALYAFWKMGAYAELNADLLQQLSAFDYRSMALYSFNRSDAYQFFNNVCNPRSYTAFPSEKN